MSQPQPHSNLIGGILTFTLYQRKAPPRVWMCGVQEQQGGFLQVKDRAVYLYRPFGAGSESDVSISSLSVRTSVSSLFGHQNVEHLLVRCTLLDRFAIEAQLQALNKADFAGMDGAWSGAFTGEDGRTSVLVIRFEGGQLLQPYGELDTQGSMAAQA